MGPLALVVAGVGAGFEHHRFHAAFQGMGSGGQPDRTATQDRHCFRFGHDALRRMQVDSLSVISIFVESWNRQVLSSR
jgi:hypothetical protein